MEVLTMEDVRERGLPAKKGRFSRITASNFLVRCGQKLFEVMDTSRDELEDLGWSYQREGRHSL